MIRFTARATALLALVVVWGFAAGDRLTVPLLSEAHAASSPAGQEDRGYDLAALSVFNRVVLLVNENYYDPKRIDPKQMLVDSLDFVEKSVPEVMVDGDPKAGRVKVTVSAQSREFEIGDIDSIFKMSMRLHQVMGFVQTNLSSTRKPDEIREVEYALVNGMLSSLDPHSVLLKPEYFKEMKLSTKGEFGGLGFVISMKEGDLTVVKVLKGTKDNPTPALKAGIKPKDRIVRIEDESTVNMELNNAVERLRGKPGSKVTITVARQGWPEPRQLTLARAKIEIESVESKLLASKVGWVRIKNFQGNTARDLQLAIRDLKGQAGGKLSGLVLDLRGNPGGLLEQAIQVSDVFLDQGTIVTTVGMSDKLREVKRAHADDGDQELPLAVLVNNGSASASEIVSGALKNLDRAVVIGKTSFGKGSVQVLYDFPDESALKLTIAQYLTPGDLSIQEIGITPDVELVPSRVTKDAVNVFAPVKSMREADLEHHLSNPNDPTSTLPAEQRAAKAERPKEKPLYSLRYLRDEKEKKEGEDELLEEEEPPEEMIEDFQVKFAKELLVAAPFKTRSQILKTMPGFVADRTAAEETRISQAIQGLGVDWSAGAVPGAKLAASLSPPAGQKIKAGDKLQLTLEVENQGTAPIHQLRAWTVCEGNPILDRREFLLGKVDAGQKKSWTVPIELPRDLASRRDVISVKFEAASEPRLEELRAELDLVEQPKPQFAYSYQVVDKAGDGDGLPDPGEKLLVHVDVRNVGGGPTSDVTFGSLKNEADEKVFIEKGRFKVGELKPGATAHGVFELELKRGYKEETMPVRLVVFDEKLEEILVETLRIPVDQAGGTAAQPLRGAVKLAADARVLGGPYEGAPVLATAKKGATLAAEARVGGFVRVEWAKGRTGFVAVPEGEKLAAGGRTTLAAIEPTMWRVPPKIALDVDTTSGGAAVDGDRFTLAGSVEDEELRDLYVFVNDQKVYFSTGQKGGAPVRFQADFPLKEGSNHVVVVAREGDELTSRRAFTVLRRKPELAGGKLGSPSGAKPQ